MPKLTKAQQGAQRILNSDIFIRRTLTDMLHFCKQYKCSFAVELRAARKIAAKENARNS